MSHKEREHLKTLIFSKAELNKIYSKICSELNLDLNSDQKKKIIENIINENKRLFSMIDPSIVKPENFKRIVDKVHVDSFKNICRNITSVRNRHHMLQDPINTRMMHSNKPKSVIYDDDDDLDINMDINDRIKREMNIINSGLKNNERPPTPDFTYEKTGKTSKTKNNNKNKDSYEKNFDPMKITDNDVIDDENEILNLQDDNNVGVFSFDVDENDQEFDEDVPIEVLMEKDKQNRNNTEIPSNGTTNFRKKTNSTNNDKYNKIKRIEELKRHNDYLKKNSNNYQNGRDPEDIEINNQLEILLQKQNNKFMSIIGNLQNEIHYLSGKNNNKNETYEDNYEPKTVNDKLVLLSQKKKELKIEGDKIKNKYNEILLKENNIKDLLNKTVDIIANNINTYNKMNKSVIINRSECSKVNNTFIYKLPQSIDVLTGIQVVDYSFPSFVYNISIDNNMFYYNNDSNNEINDSNEVKFFKKENLKCIAISPGEYEGYYLIELLNYILNQDEINITLKSGNKYVSITSDKNFNLFPTRPDNIFGTLGFTQSSYEYSNSVMGERPLDLRTDRVIKVYAKNISKESPVCTLVHNSGITNQRLFNLTYPLKDVTEIELDFKNSKNNNVYLGGDKSFMIELNLIGEYSEVPLIDTSNNSNKLSDEEISNLLGNVIE